MANVIDRPLVNAVTLLSCDVDRLIAQRQHIIRVLSAFYRAPLSISSAQPVLDLARDLNPNLTNEPSP